jgi:hypothetical protein
VPAPPNPWIQQQLKAGAPPAEVLARLEERGWSTAEAQAAIAASAPPAPRPQVEPVRGAALGRAVFAATCAGLLGGIAYGVVVIATRYDVGLVAWLVGLMAGTAVVRLLGGPAPVPLRVYAAVAAGVGMLVGRYVVFVHDFGDALAKLGAPRAGYFAPRSVHLFFDYYSTAVTGISYVWVAIAAFAALRVAGRPLRTPSR